MENNITLEVVAEIAKALKELKEQMVFVGGSIVSLYVDEPAVDEIRPTEDIDMTLNITNQLHWQEIQEKLAQLQFHPDPFGHSICSFKFKDIPIDIMASGDSPIGPPNKWYEIGFNNLYDVMVKDQKIKILSAPCFLATKFAAFNDRGNDYRTSHDIEDIIYVLDNRINIVKEIQKDDIRIRDFLKEQFQKIIIKGLLTEVLIAHIHPLQQAERMSIIEDKINQITTT